MNVTDQSTDTGIGGQYIAFTLGLEQFALPAMNIQEIIQPLPATPIPQMPNYIKGIINLRGKVITVIDLRTKFKFTEDLTPEKNCILIAQISTNEENCQVGFLVDSVLDYLKIPKNSIQVNTNIESNIDSTCMQGIAQFNDIPLVLLVPDALAEFHV